MSYYIHSLTDKNKKVIRLKNHHNKLEYKYKVFIKRKLEVKDILTKRDFFKLKNVLNDINNILEIPYENIEKLYIDRNRLFDNHEVYEIIKNNIFAIEISSEKQDKVFGQAITTRTCLRFSRGIFARAALKNIPLCKGAVYSI